MLSGIVDYRFGKAVLISSIHALPDEIVSEVIVIAVVSDDGGLRTLWQTSSLLVPTCASGFLYIDP